MLSATCFAHKQISEAVAFSCFRAVDDARMVQDALPELSRNDQDHVHLASAN
jgi:hypothetical protein